MKKLFFWAQGMAFAAQTASERSLHCSPSVTGCKLFLISHEMQRGRKQCYIQTWGQHLGDQRQQSCWELCQSMETNPLPFFHRANQFGTPFDSQDLDLHLLQTTAWWMVQFLAAPRCYLSFVRSGLLIKQRGPCFLHVLPIKQVSWVALGPHLSVRSDKIPTPGNWRFFFPCVFPASNILFCHLMPSRGYLTTKPWPRNRSLTSWKETSKQPDIYKEVLPIFFQIVSALCYPPRAEGWRETSLQITSQNWKLHLHLKWGIIPFTGIKTKAHDWQKLFLAFPTHLFPPELHLQNPRSFFYRGGSLFVLYVEQPWKIKLSSGCLQGLFLLIILDVGAAV